MVNKCVTFALFTVFICLFIAAWSFAEIPLRISTFNLKWLSAVDTNCGPVHAKSHQPIRARNSIYLCKFFDDHSHFTSIYADFDGISDPGRILTPIRRSDSERKSRSDPGASDRSEPQGLKRSDPGASGEIGSTDRGLNDPGEQRQETKCTDEEKLLYPDKCR